MATVSPDAARDTLRLLEPVHGMIYFTPHGPDAYRDIGFDDPRMMYFASRSAAMGAVPPEVTIATFFNFNPVAVRAALPSAWDIATPARVLDARLRAVDRSLRQAWGDDIAGPQVGEAAELCRRAAEVAGECPQGRTLFAAHAALPWPDEPHLVLWHAQTLLREFRGDAHVALLVAEGLDGIEALITHSATGEISAEVLRRSRSWSEQEWAAGVSRLRDRGWLEEGDELRPTPEGVRRRQEIERRTDELSAHPYTAIGEEGCLRLRTLAAGLATRVVEADLGFPKLRAARSVPAVK